MPDQAPVEDQSGYTSVLQRDFEGHVGSSSMFRGSSRVRNTANCPVSNAVPDGTKLQ